jgi:MSHA pilin protein MshA
MKTKQQGFTLIELIVVIVILGVLAAVALPRFLNVANDARRSVMQGVAGSMSGANSMVYGKAAVNGALAATGSLTAASLGITGAAFPLVWGYAADATTLARAMDINTTVAGPAAGDFTAAAGSIQHRKAPNPANCAVNYIPAANANTPPRYNLVSTGC